MLKIIIGFLLPVFVMTAVTAQTSIKWKDSTVIMSGIKVSENTTLAKGNVPAMLQEFYYGFDKASKTHIVHLVKTNLTAAGKQIYLICKFLIPAASINAAQLKVETAENDAYEGGGFLYISLRCKDDKEDVTSYEKGSHFYDFDNETKLNEMSIEAGIKDNAVLEKLLHQIKSNK